MVLAKVAVNYVGTEVPRPISNNGIFRNWVTSMWQYSSSLGWTDLFSKVGWGSTWSFSMVCMLFGRWSKWGSLEYPVGLFGMFKLNSTVFFFM